MATQPTSVEQITTTIPEYAKPYAQQLLGSVFGGQDPTTGQFIPGLIGQGYQPYGRQRTAGFSPLQQQAMEGIAGMQVSPELGEAAGLASLAGRQAGQLGLSYQPMQYQPMGIDFMRTRAPRLQQYQMSPAERVQAQTDFGAVTAPQLQQYQMGPAERVGAERFGGAQAAEYMSPYMQNVLEQQKRAAVQDYARQIPGLRAAAVRAGARGGTREALLQSEAQRNLQQQLQGIEATGLQSAFQQAQQQFGADRAAAMQAALANQQAGLTTGQQNLAAQLGIQQLGAGQRLQAQQLNQAAQLQALQMGLGQNQAAQQMMEQSRQFGANLGLQGLQQQLAAAGALGGLGMQGYQQRMGIGQAQLGAGAQGQALEQELLNQQYQDFINQQQFPYKQAEFGMGILRGIPATGQVGTLYQQPPSLLGQIAGVGLGVGSLFGAFGGKSS